MEELIKLLEAEQDVFESNYALEENGFEQGLQKAIDLVKNYAVLHDVISRLSMQEVLNYEIHSHWLASWIGFEWGQDLMGKYFAWKVRRKYNRYLVSLEERKRVLNEL